MKACPRCGRTCKAGVSSNWFPVHTCRKCSTKYCRDCGGSKCPECGSTDYSDYDKVYGS